MAKEYKFMFDRRFDDPEEDEFSEVVDMTVKSVDGIPSITQLLDTLNELMEEQPPAVGAEMTEEQADSETAEPADETPPEQAETPSDDAEEPAAEASEDVASDPSAPAAPQIVMTGFSQEELDEARQNAFMKGKLEGQAEGQQAAWNEAMQSIEKQTTDSLDLILDQLRVLAPIAAQTAEKSYTAAVELAMAVCRKILPTLSEKQAVAEIRSLLEKNFHFLKDEPKITIRLTPSLAEPVKKHIMELVKKETYAGKVAVIRDDTLKPGDCKIEWNHGGLERKAEDVLQQTEDLLKLYQEGDKTNG